MKESLLSAVEVEKMVQFGEGYERYKEELQKVMDLALAGKSELGYAKYQQELKGAIEDTSVLLQEIGAYLENYADDLDTSITKSVQTSNTIVITVIIIALILKVSLGFVIARMIVNPLKEIERLMVEAENGDLTVEGKYRSKDEIGVLTVSFNSMVSRLRELMKQVNHTSEQVAASSEELTASAEESTKASEEVAHTIQDVAFGAERQVEGTKRVKESSGKWLEVSI